MLLFPSFLTLTSLLESIDERWTSNTRTSSKALTQHLRSSKLYANMSSVDLLASLSHLGFSSVALWPLLMNWRSMLSYIPFIDRLISANEHWVSNTISEFLTSWCGGLLVTALCALLLFGMGHAVWGSLWTIVLTNWHTKCSIPKACMAYEQVHS